MGKELLEESVVAIEAVVASSKEGGVQGGSLPKCIINQERRQRHNEIYARDKNRLQKQELIGLNQALSN